MAETQDAAAGAVGEGSRQPGRAKPGAFRMLLWKEWRQQRWTLAGMTALALALLVAGGVIQRWSFELSGAAFLFALLGVPLVLSARAFAGEDEEGTATFLRELPFRPLQVFAVKFLVVVLASWAAICLVVLLGRLWPGYPDNALAKVLGLLFVLWMVAPVAAALGSLLASVGLRSLTAALLTAALLCACAFFAYLSMRGLGLVRVQPLTGLAVCLGMPGLSILLAARLSAWRHPRKLVQIVRSAGGCAAVLVLFLLPAALLQGYLSTWATPAAYVHASWFSRGLGWASVSVPLSDRPAAVAIECQLLTSRVASVALLDPSTGRTAWIDRRTIPVVHSSTGNGDAAWSPCGSRVSWGSFGAVAGASAEASRPAGAFWRFAEAPYAASKPELCVYDLKTQRTTRLPGAPQFLSPDGLGSPWYDDQWLAEVRIRGEPAVLSVRFLNVDDGTMRVLPVPLGGTAGQGEWLSVAMAPGRVLCIANSQVGRDGVMGELVIAKCTPDSTAASLVRVGDPLPGELKAVSPDGRWALFAPMAWDTPSARIDLVDLDSGAVRAVELPAESRDLARERRRLVHIDGFVAGGTGVLVSSLATFALYDIGRGAWVTYIMPQPQATEYSGRPADVSPDGGRVFQVFRDGGAVLAQVATGNQGKGDQARVFRKMLLDGGAGEAYAVVLDLRSGQMTKIPLPGFGNGPAFNPTARWFGNDHILVLSSSGICRYGLDGSREVLYP